MHNTLVPSYASNHPSSHRRNSYDKVLEDGIAEALGPNAPVTDAAVSPSLAVEHAGADSESESPQDLALDDPLLTFGVSLGGEDERMLYYYAGQVGKTPSTHIRTKGFKNS